MTTPARRLALMLLFLVCFLGAVAGANWIVNPYGAWGTTIVDRAYRLPRRLGNEASERVSTAYRIRAERPTTLLVGSSRVVVGMYIEQGMEDGVFNASMSGASLTEIAAILRLATANPDLKRVIWGVDFYAFDERFAGFRQPETRMRLEGDEWQVMGLRIRETLLSMRALEDSRRVLKRAMGGRTKGPLAAPVPWPEEVIRARLADPGRPGLERADEAFLALQLTNWLANYSGYRPSDTLASLYDEAVARLRTAGIDVVAFVPPLSRCELEVIEQTGTWPTFQQWKRELLSAGPYWDFSGYGKLEREDALFLDAAHFWPAVGHAMLRQFLGEDCRRCGSAAQVVRDAGVWVDTATVDAYLARQEAARMTSRQGSDRCVGVVEKMRRARAGGAPGGGSASTWRLPAAETCRHRAADGRRLITPGRLPSSARRWPDAARAAGLGPDTRRCKA